MCLFGEALQKSLSLRCFESDLNEIWHDSSASKYESIDAIGLLISAGCIRLFIDMTYFQHVHMHTSCCTPITSARMSVQFTAAPSAVVSFPAGEWYRLDRVYARLGSATAKPATVAPGSNYLEFIRPSSHPLELF